MNPVRRFGHLARQAWLSLTMRSSSDYWERRYRLGMTSGPGSAGRLAAFKAEVLNQFVSDEGIRSVVEFGCGDGTQLSLAAYPRYLGLDVSPAAVELCRNRFAGDSTKAFRVLGDPSGAPPEGDLALSLDVIYHLLEDDAYRRHLDAVFAASRRWVIIYSSDRDDATPARHVRHRRFTDDVHERQPAFTLRRRIENPYPDESFAEFYVFERARAEARRP
jgi:SAM-dependent methyltransferase